MLSGLFCQIFPILNRHVNMCVPYKILTHILIIIVALLLVVIHEFVFHYFSLHHTMVVLYSYIV